MRFSEILPDALGDGHQQDSSDRMRNAVIFSSTVPNLLMGSQSGDDE